jgi:hypothetical protein
MATAEQKKENKETAADEATTVLFTVTEVKLGLTYDITEPPTNIWGRAKILLDDDDKAARQAFFALSEDERNKQQHGRNCEFLGSVLTTPLHGLPGFDEVWKRATATGDFRSSIKNAISIFFGGDDPNGMKKQIVEDLVNLYYVKTQAKEFFR